MSLTKNDFQLLTRENIRTGIIKRQLEEAARRGLFKPMLDTARRASLEATIAANPGRDVWVFGYGSLMWNPAFHYQERRSGLIRGYHRQFCLKTELGRGEPGNPGLTLALNNGGSCQDVAFRIAPNAIEEELDIVWKREMLAGAYRPRWLRVRDAQGEFKAITFVIDRNFKHYAGGLSEPETVKLLATAGGRLGTCREYLENTVQQLDILGVRDGRMHDLLSKVKKFAEMEERRLHGR
jgi:glutathione-specific gamma-glutamylcyclotransferase